MQRRSAIAVDKNLPCWAAYGGPPKFHVHIISIVSTGIDCNIFHYKLIFIRCGKFNQKYGKLFKLFDVQNPPFHFILESGGAVVNPTRYFNWRFEK